MTKRCTSCKHIYAFGEHHECPSLDYEASRDKLIEEAAEANVSEEDEVYDCELIKLINNRGKD